jgi:hypothetical protein
VNAYVYCIALKDELESLAWPAGIGGAEVRTVEAGSLIAVISDWAQPAVTPIQEDVVAHHKVVEAVLRKTTPIPCRFGAILKTDFLSDFLATNADRFLDLLSVFSGRIEMDIKVFPNSVARRAMTFEEPRNRGVGEGTRYVMRKKLEHAAEKFRLESINAAQAQVEELFEDLSAETRRFVRKGGAIGEVAHLIERSAIDRYRARFTQAKGGVTNVRLALSGPWAPYSFVPDIKTLQP